VEDDSFSADNEEDLEKLFFTEKKKITYEDRGT